MKLRFAALLLAFAIIGGGAFAHGDKKHVSGTLQKITADAVIVKTADGTSVEVKLVPSTVYVLHVANQPGTPSDASQDKPAKLSDLAVGDRGAHSCDSKGRYAGSRGSEILRSHGCGGERTKILKDSWYVRSFLRPRLFLDQMARMSLQNQPNTVALRKIKRPRSSRREMHDKFHPAVDTSSNQRPARSIVVILPSITLRALRSCGCEVASKISPARIATCTRSPTAAWPSGTSISQRLSLRRTRITPSASRKSTTVPPNKFSKPAACASRCAAALPAPPGAFPCLLRAHDPSRSLARRASTSSRVCVTYKIGSRRAAFHARRSSTIAAFNSASSPVSGSSSNKTRGCVTKNAPEQFSGVLRRRFLRVCARAVCPRGMLSGFLRPRGALFVGQTIEAIGDVFLGAQVRKSARLKNVGNAPRLRRTVHASLRIEQRFFAGGNSSCVRTHQSRDAIEQCGFSGSGRAKKNADAWGKLEGNV